MKYQLIRKVTVKECHWLDEDIEKGTEVYKYRNHTYGCISSLGVACTMEEGKTPFFELPLDSVIEKPQKPGKESGA